MNILAKRFGLAVAVAALGLVAGAGGRAEGGEIITFRQVGTDVVETGAGSLNLTGTPFFGTDSPSPSQTNSNLAVTLMGPVPGVQYDDYRGLEGPQTFGLGTPFGAVFASSGSGDMFGLSGDLGFVFVPHGYVSGASLSATDTYANQTFSSLGLTPGIYNYTLPSDTLTVEIGAAVPEPSTLALAGIGGLVLAGYAWRRRRARVRTTRRVASRSVVASPWSARGSMTSS
jgi:hypothetical protein